MITVHIRFKTCNNLLIFKLFVVVFLAPNYLFFNYYQLCVSFTQAKKKRDMNTEWPPTFHMCIEIIW